MSLNKPAVINMLRQSPFKPLQAHMKAVASCTNEVPALFDALCKGDHDQVRAVKEVIFKKENEADIIKNDLRNSLPKSIFLPVDRRDLLEILEMQDNIADTAQDIAGILVERPMEVPDALQGTLLELVQSCVDTCNYSAEIVAKLDELLEMGFRGHTATEVEEMVLKLNEKEDVTDVLGLELARTLFAHEDEIKPVSVMIWYRLIEWIGDLADYSEKVGNRLRLLIAR